MTLIEFQEKYKLSPDFIGLILKYDYPYARFYDLDIPGYRDLTPEEIEKVYNSLTEIQVNLLKLIPRKTGETWQPPKMG